MNLEKLSPSRRGAITTWCPECKRKAALGRYNGIGRTCRYCRHWEERNTFERWSLYELWMHEQTNQEGP
jgi:hypothetical protein